MITDQTAAPSSTSHIDEAFARIQRDFGSLLDALRELLHEEGPDGETIAAALPERDGHGGDGDLPEALHAEHWRAITIWFQLLNLAESESAVNYRLQSGKSPWAGCFSGRQPTAADLAAVLIEPVLTAHPTQAEPIAVLQLRRDLRVALRDLERGSQSPDQHHYDLSRLRLLLDQIWRAGTTKAHRPSVTEELTTVIDRLAGPIPEAMARADRRLRRAWNWTDGDPTVLDDLANWPRLRFGNWVGGDRDGHDGVDAATTARALRQLRQAGLRLLERQLRRLADELVVSEQVHGQAAALHLLLADLDCPAEPTDRPWARAALGLAQRCHWAAQAGGPLDEAALDRDLAVIEQSLREIGAKRMATELVWPLRRHLQVFGADLADLDIRQNSAAYDQMLSELMAASGRQDHDIASWSEERRRAELLAILRDPAPCRIDADQLGSRCRDMLACCRVLADHRRSNKRGLGSMIVSMTRDVSDLLAVHAIAKAGGLAIWENGCWRCPLPVVPLFETVDDLQHAPRVVAEYLATQIATDPDDRDLQVMIGYSDSNKDAGFLAARWAQHQALEAVSAVCRQADTRLRYFHGRGGTPSRGSGPLHRFASALPGGVDHRRMRLTEQGEVIEQHYGDLAIAADHLEQLQAETCQLAPDRGCVADDERRARMDGLANAARAVYRQLVDDERFPAYWRHATPVDVLEHCCIGSRPTKRVKGGGLENVRAIPWVFGWMQNRHYLTAWYGFGEAWQRVAGDDPDAAAWWREQLEHWPFWRACLRDIQQGWLSSDMDIARSYAAMVPESEGGTAILDIIQAEHRSCGKALSELCGNGWMANRPRLAKTVALRRHGLIRLHRRQVDLLQRWRGDGSPASGADLDELVASVNALTAGLRAFG